MKTNKFKTIIALLSALMALLMIIGMVAAATSRTNPSRPTGMQYVGNRTTSYPLGYNWSLNRGYIHIINFTESQPTIKWAGVIGNISGQYALTDANGNELYDWNIVTTTGEVYATKEGSSGRGAYFGGGIPNWANMTCASHTIIKNETRYLNHSGTDEDALNRTFLMAYSASSFFVGQVPINNTAVKPPIGETRGTDTCAVAYMNVNNADQTSTFEEIMLTDQTWQTPSIYQFRQHDVIYATLIENNSVGYDGNTYDFQMILPQSGLQGDQPNIIFYFYIELV